ncbi:hypothetical protein C8A00DRAFT_47382 [Chaetomidium leptoderma]|uniref:Methylthioribose-1-phosphate isomerase n=1 Tax=Chaetomidium leptoderma TaxID=669021 RepID=A0AAN6ZS46_9PEZI|nr:hypothetical protein C8A00DRAFT_47382 [Chaetomidium leptoderma]
MATLQAIKYSRGKLLVLDQLRLPHEHHYDEVSTAEEAFDCIRSMRVRGAPAIAIVAALAHAVELVNGGCTATTPEETIAYIESRLDFLKESRPTAVDLSNAIALLKLAARAAQLEGLAHPEAKGAILNSYIEAAENILAKDLENNTSIGSFGAAWLQQQYNATPDRPVSVLTHCNTGSLATSGHGTALGIIRTLHAQKLLKHAYCTETRPYNQGSRLTSFELVFEGIPSTLVTDSMAAALFALHRERMNIGAVIVGADRVVRNGDTANKIGTYALAVLARHHGIKFVVAAPTTSIDLETASGEGIKIEERKAEELTQISGAVVNADGTVDTSRTARVAIADQRIGVWNPAFDVTPHDLIDAIVTERGAVVKGADGKFNFSQVLPERWRCALCAPGSAYLTPDNQQQPLVHLPHPAHSNKDAASYRVPLLSLHRSLVDIPSIRGSEGSAALLLEKVLTDLNYTVSLQRIPSASNNNHETQERYNVLAWPGRNAARTFNNRVLITSHIDVVPPFIPYRIDNTTIPPSQPLNFTSLLPTTLISGRGSVDAKASVAAQITATTALLTSNAIPADSVVLLYVVGEETAGDGMKFFSSSLSSPSHNNAKRPQFKSALFGEPTENKLACGHKGIALGTITAHGKAGHSGYPWLGRSATALLVRALDRLLDADLGRSARYGNTTVNVGVVEGGVAANVIAKEARALVAVRIAVGNRTTGARVVERGMRRVLEGVDHDEAALGLELGDGGYGPVECECAVDGFDTMVANYGTDVPNLQGEHTNYLYGPGSILVAHGDDEGLMVRDLEDAVEGYKRLIKHAVEAS